VRLQSRDTHPTIERKQIELLRRASDAERFQWMRSLSRTALRLARQGLKRARPNASDEEIDLLFVELHYGSELARRLREHLEQRRLRSTATSSTP